MQAHPAGRPEIGGEGTFRDYLSRPEDRSFDRRRRFQRAFDRAPSALRKLAAHAAWSGRWRHLRPFDHAYSLEREDCDLSALHRGAEKLVSAVPLAALLKIDRPVTLVAAGPSALQHDWDSVKKSGRLIATVTGAATIARERGIPPELIVVSDPRFPIAGGHHVEAAAGVPLAIEYRAAVALAKAWPGAMAERRVALLGRINRWYARPEIPQQELRRMNRASGSPFVFTREDLARDGWSHDPALGYFPSSTVAFVALQVLVALGATDIEIIGMDLGGGVSAYQNAGPTWMERDYHKSILPAFMTMQQALRGAGIRVFNHSPVCPLPPEIFRYDC